MVDGSFIEGMVCKEASRRIQHVKEIGKHLFVFGFEESYGYLVKLFIRYKDTNGVVSKIRHPTSNVLKSILEDGSGIVVRSSWTEAKIKLNISAKSDSKATVKEKVAVLQADL